jgi:hypothetical protein
MDKTQYITFTSVSRQGFALMITLSVLSVVIALTVVLLSYFSEVKKDADTTKALIQADVYYANILSQFSKFKDKKALFNHLYRFPLSLRAAKGRFSVMLKCESIAKGMNINWLGFEQDKKQQNLFLEADALFENLVQLYGVEDADRLREMLLEEIGGKQKFVKREQSRLRQKNGIISYKQFAEILSRYQLEVDDRKVGAIPWGRYFSFSGKAQKIDAEYSSPELISILFDIDLASVREWHSSIDKSALKTFVIENGGNYEEKKNLLAEGTFLGESLCTVNYGGGYRFTFKYIQGEAKHFEFYGKH